MSLSQSYSPWCNYEVDAVWRGLSPEGCAVMFWISSQEISGQDCGELLYLDVQVSECRGGSNFIFKHGSKMVVRVKELVLSDLLHSHTHGWTVYMEREERELPVYGKE